MENYDRTVELVNTAYDSAGKSSEQFAKYQDTVEYKLNQISNSWEQLRTNFFDSATYKNALDILKEFMDTLTNMDAKQFVSIGIIGLTLGKSVINNFIKSLQSAETEINRSVEQLKVSIRNKFAKDPIKITYDNSSVQKVTNEIQKMGINTTSLNSKTSELLITYIKLNTQIKQIEQIQTQNGYRTEEQNAALEEQRRIQEKITEELKKQGITKEQLNQAANNDNIREVAGNAQQKLRKTGQAVSGIASGAITTALITAISGADFGTILKTVGITALTEAIPRIAEALIPKIISFITTTVIPAIGGTLLAGITAGLAVVVGGLAIWGHFANEIEKANQAALDAERKRLKEIGSINDDLREKQLQSKKEGLSSQNSLKKLEDTIVTYQRLSNKGFLTTEEQGQLNSAIDTINNDYSDAVISYDENTNELELNTLAIEELKNTYQEQIDVTKAEEKRAMAESAMSNYKAQQTAQKLNEKWTLENLRIGEEKLTEGDHLDIDQYGNIVTVNSEDMIGAYSNFNFNELKDDLIKNFGDGSEVFKALNLTEADLSDVETFKEHLGDAPEALENFILAFQKQTENFITDDQRLEDAQADLAASYEGMEINGEKISSGLATALSKGLTQDDLRQAIDDNEIKDVLDLDNEKHFLRDYLQDYQEDGITTGKGTNLSKKLADIEVNGDKTADAIIKEQMDTFKENGEKLMSGFDGNLAEFSELPEDFKKWLSVNNSSLNNEDAWNDIRKNAEASAGIIKEYFMDLILSQSEAFNSIDLEELGENDKQTLMEVNSLLSNIGNLTAEQFDEQYKELVDSLEDSNAQNALSNYTEQAFIEAQTKLKGLGVESFENLTLNIQNAILDNLSNLNLSETDSKLLGQDLVDFFSDNNFSSDIQSILSSIDLSSSYADLLTNSQQYIDQITQAGVSSEQAAKIFNDYISKARQYIFSAVQNIEGVSVLRNNINTNLSGMSEKYESLLKAQKEYQEEGALSSETYYDLLENGFEEYVKVTSKGYELMTDKADKAYVNEAMNQYDVYKKSIEEQKRTIELLESNPTIMDGYVESDLKKVAEHYKKFPELLENYEGKYKQIIQAFIDSGEDWNTYVKNLKDVAKAMEEQEPEVYIQSLHTIVDAYDQAESEIEDLKDELADLNDELADNKEAVDEAYKSWQEAIHGTEDYQSSLDGLLNYERRLESFNNELEATKDALAEVANVSDAKNLLDKTLSLYEGKLGTLEAEGRVVQQSLDNLDKEILSNYSNFVSFDEFGNMNVDITALEAADMSDILKDDGFTKLLEKRNEMYDKATEIDKEYLDTTKEFEEQREAARDNQIKMEEKVVDILKQKMQEEVDTVKEKYDALEEADNNYLDALQDAIDKQRELRDKENQYEDLATKQKKLSLMQRDTSGANQKEVQDLEKDVKDSQQDLLDSEIDNLIESMQELYEKQKEARELEIESMESETENMQLINEMAMNIIADFHSVEDYQAWLLENDESVQEMTVTQTEQYLNEAKEVFSGYAQYVALTTEDMQLRTDEINQKADEVFENTNENVSNIGTTIQELAVSASDTAIAEAKEAYDDAVEKMNETQDKIEETKKKLQEAEDNAVTLHQSTMEALIDASQSALAEVSEYATSELALFAGVDLSGDPDEVDKFLEENNLKTKKNTISSGTYEAIQKAGGDTSKYTASGDRYVLKAVSGSGLSTIKTFSTESAAEAHMKELKDNGSTSQYIISLEKGATEKKKYATGGLVDYTGPAWVDGSPTKPEAFLNSQDTERIGEAAKLLAQLPIFNGSNMTNTSLSTNVGDTSIEIHINVDSISSDYDVNQMVERVKGEIVNVAKPIGSSVILAK